MNKARLLFDENYIIELFNKEVLPKYPDFTQIKKIKIKPYKKHIWETTYHVVVEYRVTFLTDKGKKKKLPIICTAHSNEPRKNVHDSLKFLWNKSFSKGYLSIPHPLFYSKEINGTFYRGVEGRNLYHYIQENNFEILETMIPKAAGWFKKLHNLSVENTKNFNSENSRIRTVFPGVKHTLERIKNDYPEYHHLYKEVYKILIEKEDGFLDSTKERWLVHGDAHPENVIKMGKKKIAVIDFTDLCLSDFARDIGTFVQQLEYMANRKIASEEYVKKLKRLFLESYFKKNRIKYSDSVQERIDTYYNWTALRTAKFFLLKYNPEPERAIPLLEQIKKNYNI